MRVSKLLGVGLLVLAAACLIAVACLESAARARYARHYDVAVENIPLPLPLSDAETAQLGIAAADVAHERAIERGRRYLEARVVCADCHGKDFGGTVLFDNPIMGRWSAPNITRGGVTASYSGGDWLKIVRHGLRSDGTATTMPAGAFTSLSDQEIADIATYISSLPPIHHAQPPTVIGPIFALLVVKGDIPISAEHIDHTTPRAKYPPREAATLELGKHLAATCSGCHGARYTGGPVRGGDPRWPPARNLTFHTSGLAGWSLGDFTTALRDGQRPDGTQIHEPMPIPYTSKLSAAEIEALYMYFRSLPPLAYRSE
jgi:mono/diheme cytochrome c family protein